MDFDISQTCFFDPGPPSRLKLEYLRGCQFLMFLYMIFSKINNSIQLEITKIKRNSEDLRDYSRKAIRRWGLNRVTISLTDVQSSIGFRVGWICFSSLYNLYSHILVQANNGNQVSQLRLLERDHNFMVSKMKCLKCLILLFDPSVVLHSLYLISIQWQNSTSSIPLKF